MVAFYNMIIWVAMWLLICFAALSLIFAVLRLWWNAAFRFLRMLMLLYGVWLFADIIAFYSFGITSVWWRDMVCAMISPPADYYDNIVDINLNSGQSTYICPLIHKYNGSYRIDLTGVSPRAFADDSFIVKGSIFDSAGHKLFEGVFWPICDDMHLMEEKFVLVYDVPYNRCADDHSVAKHGAKLVVQIQTRNDDFKSMQNHMRLAVRRDGW